jgi:2-polyprenyl-6-methoxyphenol hydroxylase-like FAD-dependent oxidoreductase
VVEYLGPSRRLGLIPLTGKDVAVFATVRGQTGPSSLDASPASDHFAGFPEPGPALLAAGGTGRPEAILWLPWPLLSRGAVALVGDAAHAMCPNLAQGAALAMEDAVVLAACLAHHGGVEEALIDYGRQRRARVLAVGGASLAAGSIAHLAHPAACSARDRLLDAVAPTGPILSHLLAWSPRHRAS